MSDFVQRIQQEKGQLDARIGKLEGFIDTENFRKLDASQQDLLTDQLGIMTRYSVILQQRLSALPDKPAELTYGEKAVGITFNPGKHEAVESIKRNAATLIDDIYDRHMAPGPEIRNGEVIAQATLAVRSIQVGQMWAVKAATWQY